METNVAVAEKPRSVETLPDPDDSAHFINRELSWLEFNARVLEEALDTSHPLLERVKFLSIFSSNLDEFFMIRVSGLRRQLETGTLSAPPDGMTPAAQLAAIRKSIEPMLEVCARCWHDDLKPKLRRAGIKVLAWAELKKKQRQLLERHFNDEIFPTLTPLAFDPGHPFPHISNLSINLAVVANHPVYGERFARLLGLRPEWGPGDSIVVVAFTAAGDPIREVPSTLTDQNVTFDYQGEVDGLTVGFYTVSAKSSVFCDGFESGNTATWDQVSADPPRRPGRPVEGLKNDDQELNGPARGADRYSRELQRTAADLGRSSAGLDGPSVGPGRKAPGLKGPYGGPGCRVLVPLARRGGGHE